MDLAHGYMDQETINLLENFGGKHGSNYSEEYMEEYLAYDAYAYYSDYDAYYSDYEYAYY